MENQFDGEDINQAPDKYKTYYCSPFTQSRGFTLLMKQILLYKKYPDIKLDFSKINKKNKEGWSALHIACRNSNTFSSTEIVKLLLENGADVNITTYERWPALMYACVNATKDSNNETIKLLLENKADVNIRNNDNRTALILTCIYPDSDYETVKLLLAYGANINNLFHIDITNKKIMKILLEQGHPNFVNNEYDIEFLEELCLIRLYDYKFCKKFVSIISNNFIEKIYNYNYYYKFIKKNILNTRNEIYEKPNNILSLCYEYEFYKKTTKQIPEKLIKLFDIKNEADCDTKCDFYLKNK